MARTRSDCSSSSKRWRRWTTSRRFPRTSTSTPRRWRRRRPSVRVLGVDPGTAVTGYGVIETGNGSGLGWLVEFGVIRFTGMSPLPRRLHELHQHIAALVARHGPGALALVNAFYHKNVHTTLVLGHARGVIMLAAEQAGIVIAEYAPSTIEKTVSGAGSAPKGHIGGVVARLLRLKAAPKPSDAAA